LTDEDLQDWLARLHFDIHHPPGFLSLDFSDGSPAIKEKLVFCLSNSAVTLSPHTLPIKGDLPRTSPLMAAIINLDASYGIQVIKFRVCSFCFVDSTLWSLIAIHRYRLLLFRAEFKILF
jgi:hypothetical protein